MQSEMINCGNPYEEGDAILDASVIKPGPITGMLRKKLKEYEPTEGNHTMTTHPIGTTGYERLMQLCDEIDGIHANLEHMNHDLNDTVLAMNEEIDRLRDKVINQRHQLSEVQDALERRNNGELKGRWHKELDKVRYERDQARADCAVAEEQSIRLSDEVSRLKEQMEHHDFAPESHYVMLPKDADGVPIHVGDVLVHVNNLNILTKPFEVRSLVWYGDYWAVCDRLGPTVKHSVLRHHNPDTWERIIGDALLASGDMNAMAASRTALVARCKALAGDVS